MHWAELIETVHVVFWKNLRRVRYNTWKSPKRTSNWMRSSPGKVIDNQADKALQCVQCREPAQLYLYPGHKRQTVHSSQKFWCSLLRLAQNVTNYKHWALEWFSRMKFIWWHPVTALVYSTYRHMQCTGWMAGLIQLNIIWSTTLRGHLWTKCTQNHSYSFILNIFARSTHQDIKKRTYIAPLEDNLLPRGASSPTHPAIKNSFQMFVTEVYCRVSC